jgi:malate dehydrogenase (oxaloacetate-decarboxylating)
MEDKSISFHKKLKGKIYVESKISKITNENLQLIYTPGVAKVCEEIFRHPNLKYELTSKGSNVAVVTDGTRILGLGNIGPDAALPVMEGKSVLYRKYGNLNAYPICLATTDKKKIIAAIKAIEPVFGAINLEDIESPKVLDISYQLVKELSIPIFHDDRHGTAVVVLAGLLNSLKIVQKQLSEIKIVIAGAGSAGYCIAKLLNFSGCKNISILDSKGAITKKRKTKIDKYKRQLAEFTNQEETGELSDVIKNSDVFIGVSGIKNLLKPELIRKMNNMPIIFALTNPDPEIMPDVAKKFGAKIIATGSFKFENKINNAIVFPYLMRAILELKIKKITLEILYETALAIASSIPATKLSEKNIIPTIDNPNLQKRISASLTKLIKKSS